MNQADVVAAWRSGQRCATRTLRTDGREVKSFGHVIGTTDTDGVRVALDCRYSHTTKIHSRAIQRVADRTIPCPTH